MKPIKIPESYNYISAFLTFNCGFGCSYCINRYGKLHKYKSMRSIDWINGINRIKTRKDTPITLGGGEPTRYKGFYSVVEGIDEKINVDLLTNGDFKIAEFMKYIPPERLQRRSKYASIRFSYHPGYTNVINLFWDVKKLQDEGYSVGVWAVDTGCDGIKEFAQGAERLGIDFRIKELLDSTHGNYKYPKAVDGKRKKADCKPTELLISPDGRLFKCHHDLYHGVNSYAHILDEQITLPTDFSRCDNFGLCNPCDLKIKYDRFQKTGHCSVQIREVK